jgi:DNA mismatch repair ATPase MutS
MNIHKDFKKNLKDKEKGSHRQRATKTLRSLEIFVSASKELLSDWSDLLDETSNLDYGAENYPKDWDAFDMEIEHIRKWANSFKDQLRKVK